MSYTNDYVENWLKANLNEERYLHSLGTAECAKYLAEKYNLDTEKAYFAGLIHDCAKCLPEDEMLRILKTLDLADGEISSPKTYHAPCGAYIAQNELGVNDTEVLSAIRWHTIGKTDMTPFEKIIFLADKMEERTRPKEMYEPLKRVVCEQNGLDKALLICYENTITSLVNRKLRICTQTIDIYNELLVQCSK